jgi:hypothetical protein
MSSGKLLQNFDPIYIYMCVCVCVCARADIYLYAFQRFETIKYFLESSGAHDQK